MAAVLGLSFLGAATGGEVAQVWGQVKGACYLVSTTKTTRRDTEDPAAGYIAVQVAMLRHLTYSAADLYVQHERNAPLTLYCRAGYPIEPQKLYSLADTGVKYVYVRHGDFQKFGENLLEAVETLLDDETVPQTERFAALQLALAVEIEHSVKLVDCRRYLAVAEKVGRDLTTLLVGNAVLPYDLYRVARHDFSRFSHVTNVASYSVILAERMGINDRKQLEQLATGAMLHDIGKRFISAAVLTKPRELYPDERALIETHTQRGYEELCRRPDITFEQLMMVYQHHERVDGTGYPVGILGDEIHPWAKLLAVCDVFDAMTGERPYRQPASKQHAIEYIRKNAGTHFDPEAAICWILAMNDA